MICFRGQRFYHNSSAIVAFGVQKQGLQNQRYEAKLSDKNLTILVDSEPEVFSSPAIAVLQPGA